MLWICVLLFILGANIMQISLLSCCSARKRTALISVYTISVESSECILQED